MTRISSGMKRSIVLQTSKEKETDIEVSSNQDKDQDRKSEIRGDEFTNKHVQRNRKNIVWRFFRRKDKRNIQVGESPSNSNVKYQSELRGEIESGGN